MALRGRESHKSTFSIFFGDSFSGAPVIFSIYLLFSLFRLFISSFSQCERDIIVQKVLLCDL